MGSSPPLCVGHPQGSASEVALEHMSPPQQGRGVEAAQWLRLQKPKQRQAHGRANGHGSETVSPSSDKVRGEGGSCGAKEPALMGALPSAPGGRGWHMGREGAIAAPPPKHHLTTTLCFYGRPGFLHRHSQLRISSLPSPQLSPHSQQQSSPQVCSPNPQHSSPQPPSAPADTRLMLGHAGLWHGPSICVGLTLSCLPQMGCCTLF